MKITKGTNLSRVLAKTLSVAMLALCAGGSLQAANRIYFGQFVPATISYGNQDGTGGITSPYTGETGECGTAQDPSTGRLFWGSTLGVRVGSLDGLVPASTLIPETGVCGIAVDTLNGYIYWTNPLTEQIRRARLDGSGVETLYTENTGSDPTGIAVDPFGNSGRGFVYWTNTTANQVRFARLNGSGVPQTFAANEINATGIAIDAIHKRLYWANSFLSNVTLGQIRTARIDNIGPPVTLYTTTGPTGVALDVAAGFIYWASFNTDALVRGTLDGLTAAVPLFSGFIDTPNFPSILQIPVNRAAPLLYGTLRVGQILTCTTGEWLNDDFRAFLFRRPTSYSYRWFRDGVLVPGAISQNFITAFSGSYACEVTGTNAAGSASVLSLSRYVAQCLIESEDEDGEGLCE